MVVAHPSPCHANMPPTVPARTMALAEHLRAQGAPKAASRLAAAQLDEPAASVVPLFEVPAGRIFMVDGSSGAVETFSSAMAATVERRGVIAIDAEWRPDATRSSNHPPALVQVALAASATATEADAVWLLDFEKLRRGDPAALHEAAGALDDALQAPEVQVLGFGLQADVDKLALLAREIGEARETGAVGALAEDEVVSGGQPLFSIVRRAIDLRDAATAAEALTAGGGGSGSGGGGKGGGGGLATRLARWAGVSLDKACQCSDWARRPLTAAQVRARVTRLRVTVMGRDG